MSDRYIAVDAVISDLHAARPKLSGRPVAALDVLVQLDRRERLRLLIDPADLKYLVQRGALVLGELGEAAEAELERSQGAWSRLVRDDLADD